MNTDKQGNKIAEKKVSKIVKSANIRSKRLNAISGGLNTNRKFCSVCGYRIRGANHVKGEHHIRCVNATTN